MIDFNEVGDYIRSNVFTESTSLNGVDIPLVFLVEKPKSIKDVDSYIVYRFSEIEGSKTLRHFVVEIVCKAKNIRDVLEMRSKVIEKMDFYYKPVPFGNGYVKFCMSNEGGIYHDDIADYYTDIIYFDCKRL